MARGPAANTADDRGMATKSTGDPSIDALYTVGKGKVEFVEVPELGFVAIDGDGAPGDDAFSNALQALYSVSYTAHFAVKKATGEAPRVMALEALWWVESSAQIMHIGPYSTEQISIVELHKAIAGHGSRPRGRHHEIYLGDPRTSAPEKLRTILRQPIELAV